MVSVDNGADALKLLNREHFDLVLCDLAMPNVLGYDVIKAINSLANRPKIGIITGREGNPNLLTPSIEKDEEIQWGKLGEVYGCFHMGGNRLLICFLAYCCNYFVNYIFARKI